MGIDDEPPQDSTQYSALLAFEDYFRTEDDPPQDLTQHHSALLDPFEDYSGEVPTSQSLDVSASQSLENVSNQHDVHAHEYQTKPTPLQSFECNNQIIQLPSVPNKRRHDESPQSPTSDVQTLQDNLSDSVEPPKPTPHSTQQHPPPTSQCLEVPISTSQSLENVSTQQHVHAQQYQPKPTPLQSFDRNSQIIQLPTPPNKRQKISSKRCGCKVSKCQKRYCECYAAGEVCGENCSCEGCFNKSEYEATEKRNSNMCHNPQAVYGAPTLNSFAPPPANSFTTSSNISPPQAVQMADLSQQQANPFVLSSNIFPPHAVQMADLSLQQANSFATSCNISPLPAVQMAVVARPQANPGTTYQPQQQLLSVNPTYTQQMGHRVFSVNSGSISPLMQIPPRLRQEAIKSNVYWKRLPR